MILRLFSVGRSDLNNLLSHFSVDVDQLESLFITRHPAPVLARRHILDVLRYYYVMHLFITEQFHGTNIGY
jgi:hypothetical protein